MRRVHAYVAKIVAHGAEVCTGAHRKSHDLLDQACSAGFAIGSRNTHHALVARGIAGEGVGDQARRAPRRFVIDIRAAGQFRDPRTIAQDRGGAGLYRGLNIGMAVVLFSRNGNK